jgi:copper chaperone CopZ
MKKIMSIILSLIFVISLSGFALAAEKVVQLEVPGCRPCGAARRINEAMKNIDGVKNHESRVQKGQELLIVTFYDQKTTVKKIIHELKKVGFNVNGKPAYLK